MTLLPVWVKGVLKPLGTMSAAAAAGVATASGSSAGDADGRAAATASGASGSVEDGPLTRQCRSQAARRTPTLVRVRRTWTKAGGWETGLKRAPVCHGDGDGDGDGPFETKGPPSTFYAEW